MFRATLAALVAAFFLSCSGPSPVAIPKAEFAPAVRIAAAPEKTSGVPLTVATWNVEGLDLGGDAPSGTYDGVALALKNASVEIVAFEEIQVADVPKLQAALAKHGGDLPNFAISSQSDGYNSFAVASKHPIIEATEVVMPSSGKWPRSVYKVRVDAGRGLTLFVCHLKSGADASSLAKRVSQAEAIGRYFTETYGSAISTETLVLLGDMNTMSTGDREGARATLPLLGLRTDGDSSNDFESMTESLFAASDSYTWEGSVSGVHTRSSLDHILLSKGARARYISGSLRIYRTDPSSTMTANSDHYPVVLDITP